MRGTPTVRPRVWLRARALAARHPHVALLGAVGATLATEPAVQLGRDETTTLSSLVAASALGGRAAIAALCLFIAWEGQRRLELARVLACAACLGLGWTALHLLTGVSPDQDLHFYAEDGSALLAGSYPSSEYPTGAVLLFAVETWLGGVPPHALHAVAMVGFHLLTVGAIWSLRTRWSPWLAAFVAVWPLNVFHWEFRYDVAPTALLILGLALAMRDQWPLAGAALGVGAALKWSPGLAFLTLTCWLLARGKNRAAIGQTAGFALSFAILTLPFLAWDASNVIDAYRLQADRGLTGESVWYLVFAPLGLTALGNDVLSADARVPASLNVAVTIAQLILLAIVVFLATRVRARPQAVALAALTPAAFLLTNRVFSSQFLVLLVAVWAVAAALVVASRREQLVVGLVAAGASTANAAVHPYTPPAGWRLASVVLFVLAIGLTTWLVKRVVEPQVAVGPP